MHGQRNIKLITSHLLHVRCFTIFRKTIALLSQKLYAFCKVAIKYMMHTFPIYNAVIIFVAICISSFRILKTLVKIINSISFISVGSRYLFCMLAMYVFSVSSCVWVHNGVGILRGPRTSCYVVPLSCCAG